MASGDFLMFEKMFEALVDILSSPVFQIELAVLLTVSFFVALRLRRVPRLRVLSHHRDRNGFPTS